HTLSTRADAAPPTAAGAAPAPRGGSPTYTIVVRTAGPSTAGAQQVSALSPAAITAVSWTALASPGSSVAKASGSGNILTTVTLLPGGSVTFSAVAQISTAATGSLTNTATVAVPPGARAPADNNASHPRRPTPHARASLNR